MGSRNQTVRWYWPTVGNVEEAVRASNQGMWAAVVCAGATAIFATISIFSGNVAGIGPTAYVDALLFAGIAWGTRWRSRVFAIAGLSLFVIEKAFQIATQPDSIRFGIFLAVILLLCFIAGVRGNFAYQRYKARASQSLATEEH